MNKYDLIGIVIGILVSSILAYCLCCNDLMLYLIVFNAFIFVGIVAIVINKICEIKSIDF